MALDEKNRTITISARHPDTGANMGSMNMVRLAVGQSFDVMTGLTHDMQGHVTGLSHTQFTLPSDMVRSIATTASFHHVNVSGTARNGQ